MGGIEISNNFLQNNFDEKSWFAFFPYVEMIRKIYTQINFFQDTIFTRNFSMSYRKIIFTQHNFQYFINLLYFLIGKMKLQSVRSRDWGLRTWVSGRPQLVFETIIFFRENARLKWDIWESQKKFAKLLSLSCGGFQILSHK